MAAVIRMYLTVIFTFLYIASTEQAPAVQADPLMEVVVSPNGTYQLKVKGVTWLNSAPTFFIVNNKRYSDDDGSLKVLAVNQTEFKGHQFGDGTQTSIYFQADTFNIIASVLAYVNSELITFKVDFPDGAPGINHINFDVVLCGFPGFVMDGNLATLGFLSLGGEYAGYTNQMVGRWNKTANLQGGLEGSAPLNLFDKSFNAITIGPQDNFMVSSLWRDIDHDHVYWGIMSGVTELPKGFSYQIFTAYANDVTQSMYTWGHALSSLYYRLVRPADPTAHTIGYWTGEGSYYYDAPTGYSNYEEAILDVFEAAKNRSIPYRYVEFGSWWFTKGQGNGVKEWTAPADVFPNGQANLHTKINVPIVATNNFWANDTVYATQNGGQYEFDFSDDMALPKNESFWDFLFGEAKQWGMVTYVQENMTEIFRQFTAMKTSLTYGRDWLTNMGTAAQKHGITIQLSGAIPRIALSAFEIPAITQVRVSPNYGASVDQWKIGLTSVFVSALQISISKDGFLSQVHEGAMGDPNSERQSVVSALSKGTFETGDMAWKTNTTLVMKSCLRDGTILRPAIPAVAVDSQLLQLAFQDGIGPDGQVWGTYTDVTKIGHVGPAHTYGVIFTSGLTTNFSITPAMAGFTFEYPRSKIFSAKDPRNQYDFADDKPFILQECPADDYCLYYTSPVLMLNEKEVLILGELNKWLPISRERIANITVTDVITIDVMGSPNEKVEMWFSVDGNIGALAIDVENNGVGALVFEDKPLSVAATAKPLPFYAAVLTIIVALICRDVHFMIPI